MAHQVLEVMEHLTRLGESFTLEEEELEELVQVQGVLVEAMVEEKAVEEEVEVWSKVAELAEELWSTGMGLGDASTTSTISILPRSWSSWSIESNEEGGFLSWSPRL